MNLYESIKSNSNKSINDAWWKTNYQRAIDYVDTELPEILVDEFYGGDWDTYNCDSGKHVALTVLNKLGSEEFEKRLKEIDKSSFKESDSSFDVEGLADRIDILMSDMDPYEHMDVYGSYNPTEESYQDTLDSLYNNPQSILDSISSYDIIDWEDDIQTEYNEIIQDLKEWIKISRVKNESEDSSKKGYWVLIKMKNNKQVLHLFNTEDEMYDYLNLLSHYVGQGEVEILDYTSKNSKKNESEVKPTDEEFARYKDLMSKVDEKEKDIRIKAGSQAVMSDDLPDEVYNADYYKRVHGWSDDDLNLVNKVDSYINSSTPKFVVYTTSEIAPGEYKTDVYGEYTSNEQASDICGELRSKGIGARVVVESDNPYAPTDEDWEDINHWYNDNYEEMWDNQAKRSWMTSEDIEWLSNQNHNTKLTEISMNYRPTGDVETDERRLNDLATTYFYDKVGIYNQNIDGLCTRWAHDQALKINEAEGNKLSPEELVKSAYEHITSDLGKEVTIEAVLDDIMNNYDQDYFKGETPEDSKNDFDSVKAYLRRLGLSYKDLDESETVGNITYLDGNTILDDLGSDYECISAMYDQLGVDTNEEFFPETICTDADNSNLYIRNVDGKTEWVLNKDGKTIVCAGRDSANIPIVYFDNEVIKESDDYIVRYTVFDHDSPIAQDISSFEEAKRIAKEDGGDSITKYTWYHEEDYDDYKEANKTEDIYLSESDEDDSYDNPVYTVEIRDLHLTNHGYHNNSDIAWGRVKLVPKDGSGIDDPLCGLWDVIYFRENQEVACFKIGYPVKAVANALYDYNTDEGNYTVRINSEDIPVDDLYEKIDRDCTKLSVDAEGAIEGAIERAIHDDSINKVNYQ